MNFIPGYLYHVYNRGNNSGRIFHNRSHYFYFMMKIKKELLPTSEILSYCLMPTHYHLLLIPREFETKEGFRTYLKEDELFHPLVRKIGSLQSSYSRALNKELNETGSRFQQKAKAKLLDLEEDYPINCFHYIHQNPLRARLVSKLDQWEFSSYRDYAGLRNPYIINPEMAFTRLDIPADNKRFVDESHSLIPEELYCWTD
jgi:putative transposase